LLAGAAGRPGLPAAGSHARASLRAGPARLDRPDAAAQSADLALHLGRRHLPDLAGRPRRPGQGAGLRRLPARARPPRSALAGPRLSGRERAGPAQAAFAASLPKTRWPPSADTTTVSPAPNSPAR